MNKPTKLLNTVYAGLKNNRAEILTGVSIAFSWLALYQAFKAGPKAEKILEKRRTERESVDSEDKKTQRAITMKLVKEMTPVVTVPILLQGVATASSIGSNYINGQKIAALSAAYTVTRTALKEHKDKVAELFGEGKAQDVREAIAKDHLTKAGLPKDDKMTYTGTGIPLCYDEYSGRYFNKSAEDIRRAFLKISSDLQREMWIPVNDLYEELELGPCKMGDVLGWHVEDTDRGLIPFDLTAILVDDQPCLCLGFDVSYRDDLRFG